MSKRLVLASNNAKKAAEMQALLAPLGIEVIPQSVFGVGEAEEPHPSFVENALAKARHASAATGLPAVADDSGLCVDALGGAPGVRSARFAGEAANDAANRAALRRALQDVADPRRRARFVCVLALAVPGGAVQLAHGECPGRILAAEKGTGGFGYDSLFVPDGHARTFAEMSVEEKESLSHRGRAIAGARESFRLP